MGPRLRLPQYVHAFIDNRGRPRYYVRRRGFKRVPLPGLPWSVEFMGAYEAALAGAPRLAIGASRRDPGSVNGAVGTSLWYCAWPSAVTDGRRSTSMVRSRSAVCDS